MLALKGDTNRVSDMLYIRESVLIGAMLDFECTDDVISFPDIPCEDRYVVLVSSYLKFGCLPTPITDMGMYSSLESSFDYLHCNDACLSITLDDMKLNMFNRVDFDINVDTSLLPLFDRSGGWIDVEMRPVGYPLVAASRGHMLERRPTDLDTAKSRIFGCSSCRRRGFVDRLFLLLGKRVCIAGGSLQYIFNTDSTRDSCMMSDLDVFLVGVDFNMVEMLVMVIAGIYREYFGFYMVLRTAYTVTFFRLDKKHKNTIQVVLKNHASVEAILSGFDLDSSCFAYDGENVMVNRRGLRCIRTSANIVDTDRQSMTFEKRLVKYHHKYDVGIAVPNFQKHRVSYEDPLYGLSTLLAMLDSGSRRTCLRRAGTPHDAYGNYGKISDSVSFVALRSNVNIALRYSRFANPFILRMNNPLVYRYFGSEEDNVDPILKRDRFIDCEGSYQPMSGPWYADAYGASSIPEWKASIDVAAGQYERHIAPERKEWNLPTGPSSILSGGY